MRTFKQIENELNSATRDLEMYRNQLEYYTDLVKATEQRANTLGIELNNFKEKKRFRIGDKFNAWNSSTYILTFVELRTPRLINISNGLDKAGTIQFDIMIKHDELGEPYITELPTAFPGDFGEDYKDYGAKKLNTSECV